MDRCVVMYVCMCGDQGLMSEVFLSCSPSYSLRQGLLLDWELFSSTRLAG